MSGQDIPTYQGSHDLPVIPSDPDEEDIFDMEPGSSDSECVGRSDESGGSDACEGVEEWREEVREDGDRLTELRPALSMSPPGQSDSSEDYVVYGTTPPRSGRFEKMANKGHKHKTTKKLSPGLVAMKPKSHSKTDSAKPPRQNRPPKGGGSSKTKGGGSAKREKKGQFLSPTHNPSGPENEAKTKKRKMKQLRKQERDSKSSLNQQRLISSPKLTHAHSVDLVDYTPTNSISLIPSSSSIDEDLLTASLQPHLLSSWKESTLGGENTRPRRIQSDFSISSQMIDERHYCPPERKKFYRSFVNALKHSGISGRARPMSESTPMGPPLLHVARMRSENLALENPFGDVWERIWVELKAYLDEQQPEVYQEWLFYRANYIQQVLRQVIDFQMPTLDPVMSLNSAFLGVEDDDVEPSRIPSGRSDSSFKHVAFSKNLEVRESVDEPDTQQDDESALNLDCDVCHQDSVSSGDSEIIRFEPQQFLSQVQLTAIRHVCKLLKSLEEIESLFPNRKKLGDEYPNYRTLNFRRRVSALILWNKVTSSVATKLSNLSTWLGVQVELADVCKDLTPEPTDDERPPLEHQSSVERSGILVTSPKSPTKRHARFSFRSESSEEGVELTHQASTGQSTNSTGTLQRLFSNYQSLHDNGPYKEFVNRSLKKKGLTYLMKALSDYITPALKLAQYALCPPCEPTEEDEVESHPRPHLTRFMDPTLLKAADERQGPPVQYDRTTSTGPQNWIQEFELMGLPLFTTQYIQLVHVPLDVMHECVRLQLELRPPQKPSPHSVKQLVRECRETLQQAIDIRTFYRERMALVTCNSPGKQAQVESDIESFETDLKCVLEVYFDYLQSWVQVSSGHILEEEWRHVKNICTNIRGGEAEAGRRFCDMASHLLETTGDVLETRMDECCRILHKAGEQPEQRRAAIADSCRSFKELFVDIRERASKALGFAKMLRKDLEIAADFTILTSTPDLLQALQASDHVQVKLCSNEKLDKMLFVPEHTSSSTDEINQLLNVGFAPSGPDKVHYDPNEPYLLLVNLDVATSQSSWNGRTIEVKTSAETTSAISEMHVESLKMIVINSANLISSRSSFLSAVGSAVRLVNEQTSSHENVAERITDLKSAACFLATRLMQVALQVMEHLGMEDTSAGDDLSKPYQATMHSCFNLGFEYVREVFRLLGDDMAYSNLGQAALEYAVLWIRFVLDKCDRGRGTRPRWASTGLEFMKIACAPRTLAEISQTKFEALRKLMDRCVDHVVGEAPTPIRKDKPVRSAVRSRRPWRKPPLASRAFSDTSMLGVITPVDEELELVKTPHYPLKVAQTNTDVEQGIIRVERDTPGTPYRGMERIESGLLYAIPVPTEALPIGPSPPVSTESVDSVEHSSGVDSPLHMSGEVPNSSGYNPMVTPQRLISITPTLDRTDSAVSTSRFYMSTHSLTRTDSGSSLMGGEAEKTKKIRAEVQVLERNREVRLQKEKVIGKVRAHQSTTQTDKLSNLKVANFKWQRGRKLGEGRFGKVYECRNLTSGEVNAVKQISIQEKDSSTVQTILDEINVFQRLKHENIVKFYGVEIHHNELYMFMEYCNEGTLWSISQQGLPEDMVRHYTKDIVKAVYFLHDQGIVHRDIKGCNIFLSSNGSIKLGDFGLSVQLKNYHKTMPNEIKQQVGTVPYMSPEVILNQSMGRPMDIWSIGCVVVEMATGKLPWSEFDNQYQIMFQLGSGNTPPVTRHEALSEEGHNFLNKCFIFDPQERWKAIQLLDHPFVKVDDSESSTEED